MSHSLEDITYERKNPSSPARMVAAISPSDSVDLTNVPKEIYVGTGGNISLLAAGAPPGASPVLFKNVPSGSRLNIAARRIYATGTTATDIVGLYAGATAYLTPTAAPYAPSLDHSDPRNSMYP